MSERISALEMAVGFETRLYDRASVANWVDGEVFASERVEGPLLELTVLVGKADHEIALELEALARAESVAATYAELTLACMGVLVETHRVELRAAISHLFGMANSNEFSEDDCAEVYYLDDGYDLAAAGYQGTLEGVRADFLAFTSRYRHLLVGVP